MSRIVLLTLACTAALAYGDPVPLNACAATTCLVGSICVENNGVARCVAPPNSGNNNCTGQFEEWKQCGTCEKTCENKNPFCNRMCQPSRCMCREGFFRNKEGNCVTENDCDTAAQAQCKNNELFTTCSTMCEAKCGQYGPMPCVLSCGPPKCQCSSGFYRNDNGECVSRAECDNPTTGSPQKCKKNQVFSQCSSMCIPKCGEYEGNRPCMAMCGPPKCECARGFYLGGNGECLSRAECEATPHTPGQSDCKPNEIFRECASQCEEKCGEKLIRACPASCGPVAKCQCQDGFFRNRVGDCVNKFDCDNDQEITCANIDCVSGMICQMQNGEPKCIAGPVLTCNTVKCAGGNHCEIANGQPKCLPDRTGITCANVRCAGPCTDTPTGPSCGPRPANACGSNEEFRECANKCFEPFCGDEGMMRNCFTTCSPGACECKKGFVRDRTSSECINRDQCPPTAMNTCAKRNCGIAMRCIMERGRTQCVPMFTAASSALAAAPPPAADVAAASRPARSFPTLPDSCDKVTCKGGGTCYMEEVKCVSGPCKPVPKCRGGSSIASSSDSDVDNTAPATGFGSVYQPFGDNCDQMNCKDGEICAMETIRCFAAPCKKQAVCRPSHTICTKKNEIWNQCFNGCGATCQRQDVMCAMFCGNGGCTCDTTYIRDEVSGECVKEADCPASRPTLTHIPLEKPHILEIADDSYSPSAPVAPVPSNSDPYSLPGDEIAPSCEGHTCPSGQKCELHQVQCIRAPCFPIPSCVPGTNNEPQCVLPCPLGQSCVLETVYCKKAPCPPKPSCKAVPRKQVAHVSAKFASYSPSVPVAPIGPVPPPNNCESANCPVGMICKMQTVQCFVPPCDPVPECQRDPNYIPGDEIVPSCEGHTCASGEKCELQQVQCFRAPCYPIPNCVPDTNTSPPCVLPCPYGMSCVLETVYCKKAPCPPKPTCKVVPPKPGQTCTKDNEVWSQCFTGCESTCQTRDKMCTMQCGPGGCACETGFIRDEQTGDCVRESHCPRLYDGPKTCDGVYCRRDMECKMRRGVPVCLKRPYTSDPIPMGTMPPSVTCDTLGCQPGEKCVQKSYGPQCEPIQCGANQHYEECFSGCEGNCNNKVVPFCPAICGSGGCKCNDGFMRNDNGECVLPSACPSNPSCGPNQVYDKCAHGCEATCDNLNPSCTEQCGPGACTCANGYVRNANLDCIKQSSCPRRTYG